MNEKEDVMARYLRQLLFLVFALALRWPVWFLIWLIGKSGLLNFVFNLPDRQE